MDNNDFINFYIEHAHEELIEVTKNKLIFKTNQKLLNTEVEKLKSDVQTLQQINAEIGEELRQEREKSSQLGMKDNDIGALRNELEMKQRSYEYLVKSVKERDSDIEKLQREVEVLKTKLGNLESEKKSLERDINELKTPKKVVKPVKKKEALVSA